MPAAKPKRTCPVPMCGAPLKPRMLMCAPCWRKIKRPEREEFYASFTSRATYEAAAQKVIQLALERNK